MTKKGLRKSTPPELSRVVVARQLNDLVHEMYKAERNFSPLLKTLHDNFKLSGANLIHYLVLRNHEIRAIQEYLHHSGLSSLTNSESHTLYQVQNVLSWLHEKPHKFKPAACNVEVGARLRSAHTEHLLGAFPTQDRPHIMVTFSPELTLDRKLVEELLNEGMSVARINCAHDDPEVWLRMINVLKKAVAKTGKACKIYMDIAGPKIRIKSIGAGHKKENSGLPVWEGKELWLQYAETPKNHMPASTRKKKDIVFVEPRELLTMVKEGEHIFFDDGKFEAKVTKVHPEKVVVRIMRISAKKHLLKPEKGINLPDSDLMIQTLTDEDKRHIPFICQYADMVGYSFVSSPMDIELLRSAIHASSKSRKPAIILKIERLAAVQQLPAILLNGMKDESLGVMIARGDLAVEIGFERMSEIQEEILWICEAAHVPVIWATQVLETLNKTGYATRSEITDAAMGVRAECVMLNKGKYILKAVKTLENILTRQLGHLKKKRYIMRPLGIAKSFIQP